MWRVVSTQLYRYWKPLRQQHQHIYATYTPHIYKDSVLSVTLVTIILYVIRNPLFSAYTANNNNILLRLPYVMPVFCAQIDLIWRHSRESNFSKPFSKFESALRTQNTSHMEAIHVHERNIMHADTEVCKTRYIHFFHVLKSILCQ